MLQLPIDSVYELYPKTIINSSQWQCSVIQLMTWTDAVELFTSVSAERLSEVNEPNPQKGVKKDNSFICVSKYIWFLLTRERTDAVSIVYSSPAVPEANGGRSASQIGKMFPLWSLVGSDRYCYLDNPTVLDRMNAVIASVKCVYSSGIYFMVNADRLIFLVLRM